MLTNMAIFKQDVFEKELKEMDDFVFVPPKNLIKQTFPVKEIDNIQFGIYSPEEIIRQSVCKIESSKMNGNGSVYDLRMGSMEQDEVCVSCETKPRECPGHFGHIELNTYVLHPMYMRYITNFLKCICFKCYRVVLTSDHLKLDGISAKMAGDTRFEKCVERLEKADSCYYCDSPKPKITFQQKTSDISMKFKEKKVNLSDLDIKKIFDNIIEDDVKLLGFNPNSMHPKNLVLSVLPVIPPRARPYVITDNVTCDDDLTMQYIEIVKANKNLLDPDISDSKKEKCIQTLKFRIKTLMNNSQGKSRCTSGRPIKGIKERLSGKDGLIRSNLMGKRRNQSARSVISADPTVRTDELVVPEQVASNLTVPEIVAPFNIKELQKIVNEGKANIVINPDGTKITLKYAMYKNGTQILWKDKVIRGEREIDPFNYPNFELKEGDKIKRGDEIITDISVPKKKDFKLEIGQVVERQLKNGDVVLFNRQPTLHRASMMAKKIVIRPCRTFRFNLASTKSFNADFDGDEMNVFLPQELDARAELMNLSTTMHNIMSSQSTKNIICITQDSLLGSYLLTKDDRDLGRDMFFDICMKGDNWSSSFILDRIKHIRKVMKEYNKTFSIYCGKSLFSLMLPKNFNYIKKNDVRKDEPVVKIVKGVLIEGALAKSNLGQAHNSIIHVLHKEYGMQYAIDFINNCQFISNQYLIHKGFSIGIKDCVAEEELQQKTEDIAYKCFIEAKTTETTISHDRIRELKIISILDKARDMSMILAKKKLKPDNAFISTVTSGSKGEYFNITQITSMLGQQMHMGKRIQKTLNRGHRTLPHYPKENLTIEQEFESQGFIKHSFLHGLNPQEFIWHAVSGREGCSNTSLQTANSGYIQRKMVKVLEDVQVKYDGTVRNTNNWVVQWSYGGDGFDREKCSFLNSTGNVFFSDVSRIAERLNNDFELKQEEEEELLIDK
jgi:DNA-directed RNA polymerase beta' subunit